MNLSRSEIVSRACDYFKELDLECSIYLTGSRGRSEYVSGKDASDVDFLCFIEPSLVDRLRNYLRVGFPFHDGIALAKPEKRFVPSANIFSIYKQVPIYRNDRFPELIDPTTSREEFLAYQFQPVAYYSAKTIITTSQLTKTRCARNIFRSWLRLKFYLANKHYESYVTDDVIKNWVRRSLPAVFESYTSLERLSWKELSDYNCRLIDELRQVWVACDLVTLGSTTRFFRRSTINQDDAEAIIEAAFLENNGYASSEAIIYPGEPK